jgi:GTP-binding protein Era
MGVQDIKDYWARELPEGPWLFPEDQLSDLPQKLLAAEITREEIFHRLHEELPYSIWVETESWEEFKDGSVKIVQSISGSERQSTTHRFRERRPASQSHWRSGATSIN